MGYWFLDFLCPLNTHELRKNNLHLRFPSHYSLEPMRSAMLSPRVSLNDYLPDSPLAEDFPQTRTRFQMSMTDIETSTPETNDRAAECRDPGWKQVDRDNKLEISSLHTELSRYARIEAELCDKDLRIRELLAKVHECQPESEQLQTLKDEGIPKGRDDHAATK